MVCLEVFSSCLSPGKWVCTDFTEYLHLQCSENSSARKLKDCDKLWRQYRGLGRIFQLTFGRLCACVIPPFGSPSTLLALKSGYQVHYRRLLLPNAQMFYSRNYLLLHYNGSQFKRACKGTVVMRYLTRTGAHF